jgi:hypothetical protein
MDIDKCLLPVADGNFTMISPCSLRFVMTVALFVSLILLLIQKNSLSEDEEEPLLGVESNLQGNRHRARVYDGYQHSIVLLSYLIPWFHVGESLSILVRFMPANMKIPPFISDKPLNSTLIIYLICSVIWILHFTIPIGRRWIFHSISFFVYALESTCLFIYILFGSPLILSKEYILGTEFIVSSFCRLFILALILFIWALQKIQTDQVTNGEEPCTAMVNFNPPSTISDFFTHFKKLIPFLWPTGKNSFWLQLMMIASFLCIFLGRYVNVMVPTLYKQLIDAFTKTYLVNFLSSYIELESEDKFPIGQIFIFCLVRLLAGGGGLLAAIQKALWVPIGQFTTKSVSLKMFTHLNQLSLRFHLNRKTGEILRVQGN